MIIGVGYDINQTRIIGVDPQLSFDVISNEFKKAADESDDNSTEEASPILDKIKLCKQHIVMKFTPMSSDIKSSGFIIASESVSSVTPARLSNMVLTAIKTLYMYHFSVCVIVSDGATENNSLFDGLSTFSTENMLPSDLKSKFKDVNFEYKCVRKHPISHDLIFLIADMPHLVKKIVNALEMSSLKKSKRNMEFDGCPLNCKMIQDIWRKTNEGCHHRLMETKLSEKHFNKDGFSRMNVSLATQLLSSSVASMMEAAIKDVNISRHLRLKPWQYRHIINLSRKVDRLVDICNGRSRNHEKTGLFNTESGLEMQHDLLEILEYFSIWNSSLKKKDKSDNCFLPNQTWKSIQSLILGLVGCIQLYVIENGESFVPRRTNTDTIEHHFGNSRQSVGGGNAPTAMQQRTNDARSSVYNATTGPTKGNNASAPTYDGKRKKY